MPSVAIRSLATLAVAAACLGGPLAVAADDAPAKRTFSFTYEVKIPKAPPGTKRLDAWVPTPFVDELQKVDELKVEATQDGKAIKVDQTKDETYGNHFAYVGLDNPTGDVVLRWTATITRTADNGQGTGPVVDRFKQADALVPITGKAAELAKEVGADKADVATRERAKKVYDEVLTTMTYDKVAPGWGKGDFTRACEVGKGNCTDFHAKFTGIARAGGIPVRFTMGIPLGTEASGKAAGYHCWAHFLDGKTWTPVDISEAQKINAKDPAKAQWFFGHLDPDRLSLSVGRDLKLVPAQKGAPLQFLAYPYVEFDGVVADIPKENRTFSWQNK